MGNIFVFVWLMRVFHVEMGLTSLGKETRVINGCLGLLLMDARPVQAWLCLMLPATCTRTQGIKTNKDLIYIFPIKTKERKSP